MVALRDQVLTSDEYARVEDFTPVHGAYLYQLSVEERSLHVEGLRSRASSLSFVQFTVVHDDAVRTADGQQFSCRRSREVSAFLAALNGQPVFVDITGMSHELWAPLVRSALETGIDLRVVYVEPRSYARSAAPRRGEIFDLNERIQGVAPLPSFATIAELEGDGCFVAFLGFEGARFSLMVNEMEPKSERVYPVIGVPGFRPEYPFHSVLGNAVPLAQTRSFHRLRFARSNCPFSAYFALEEIGSRHTTGTMQVALVGTKPHALGSVIFAIKHPLRVELLYDYVIRKPARTEGTEQCFVYNISDFVAEL